MEVKESVPFKERSSILLNASESSSKERTATSLFSLLSGKSLATSILWWLEQKPEDKEPKTNGCVDSKKSEEGGRRES